MRTKPERVRVLLKLRRRDGEGETLESRPATVVVPPKERLPSFAVRQAFDLWRAANPDKRGYEVVGARVTAGVGTWEVDEHGAQKKCPANPEATP
jgi:hypothetical protein